LFEDRGDDI